uniref:uncharacterized protein LOC122583521 n=1 Tax=Erigeron canadensis TaxID=72917 RepID=UPI001CB95B16|nr:uncharacterized protein LOC122583521 [Erigeron canadensis]
MVDEIDRLKNTLKGDVSKCGCTVWASCGLPCSCRLLTYMQERRRVQEYEIDAFWCRLDINPSTCLPGNVKKDSDDDEPVEDFCGELDVKNKGPHLSGSVQNQGSGGPKENTW